MLMEDSWFVLKSKIANWFNTVHFAANFSSIIDEGPKMFFNWTQKIVEEKSLKWKPNLKMSHKQ